MSYGFQDYVKAVYTQLIVCNSVELLCELCTGRWQFIPPVDLHNLRLEACPLEQVQHFRELDSVGIKPGLRHETGLPHSVAEAKIVQCATDMVAEIDPDNPGKLRIVRGAYSRRVAGVVSGANGLPTGAILGNLPGSENAPPIALSGRVWVYCDATENAIEPGDLLTTSGTPGHAMKVTDYPRAQGAILGKAMSRLDGEKGLVLVLVTLQ